MTPYNKNKLQPKSKECIFLEYPPLSRGYICLDPSSNGIYIACFVLFNESLFPFTHNYACTNPHIPFNLIFLIGFLPPLPFLILLIFLLLVILLLPFLWISLLLYYICSSFFIAYTCCSLSTDPPPIPDVPASLPNSSSSPLASSS